MRDVGVRATLSVESARQVSDAVGMTASTN